MLRPAVVPARPPRRTARCLVVLVLLTVAACGGDDGGEGADGGATTTSTSAAPRVTDDAPGTTATTGPDTAACDPADQVRAWPLRRRLASLLVVGVDPSGTGEATAVVTEHHVGGVFVGGDDTTLLTSGALTSLREGEPLGLVVTVDEEGGRVQRIDALEGPVPSAREMAATMTPAEVEDLARERAEAMAALGVTQDAAPVLDVSSQPDGTVIGDRSWSDDPDVVATYAGAYAEGLAAGGVTPVYKHFPGHGSASGDSHEGAVTTPPLEELRAHDLRPYAELLPDAPRGTAVMLGHLDVPGLTEDGTPTSLSPATVALLRDDHGFDGVVMTDDLAGMAAVTARYTPPQAAVAALAAGVDLLLFADLDVPVALDGLEAAVRRGEVDEGRVDEAVRRVLALKGVDPCSVPPGALG